jgi:twinkle protein
MKASELSQILKTNVEQVCMELLPNGKRDGRNWIAGGVTGEPGKSLKVALSGELQGRFCDFAVADDRGDLLDLWQMTRSVNLVEACRQAKNFLGIEDQDLYKPKSTYKKPENYRSSKDADEIKYLKGRGLTDGTIKAFRITGANGKVYFPFFKGNELVACKWRSTTEKETRATSEGQKPILFGWQALGVNSNAPENGRTVTICEGEIDAMSLHQMGIPALSVPFGVNNLDWIENEWSDLDCFEMIYICMDTDKPGTDAAKKIIGRLGAHRCKYVTLPAKDANECLTKGLIPQLKIAFERSVTLDPAQLRRPISYRQEVIWEIHPELRPEGEVYIPLPGRKSSDFLRFRDNELVIVNGVNGHGKSQFVGHNVIEAVRWGFKCCIASMEMKPAKTLGRMIRQMTGMEKPSESYISLALQTLSTNLHMFDILGTANIDEILDVFTYAARRYGVKVFVIDSMMKCGVADDDYSGQKKMLDKICDFKNRFEVTVFLITHSRKGESEERPTGKFDVKGTGSITDLADTVLTVWRNKKKEKALKSEDPEEIAKAQKSPDCMCICSKQRNGSGWEGNVLYWFDQESLQYLNGDESTPFNYLDAMK